MNKELEIANEAAKLFKDYDYTVEEAIEVAREICEVKE